MEREKKGSGFGRRFARGVYLMGRRYVRHQVGMRSAALAFYLLFAIFPMLIFFSALLGLLQLNVDTSLTGLKDLLPSEVMGILRRYLTYVSNNPSPRLLTFGLVFSLYFPMRATNSLIGAVREAYHLGPSRGAVRQLLKTLIYTLVLTAGIVLTVVLMTVSNRILAWAVVNLNLPPFAAQLWARLRFPIIGAVGFLALFFLYALAQDGPPRRADLWPGTLAALGGWMGASWLYTFYVNNIAHYSLLYGSIGTLIVVLIWLNLSAMMLILGAELNGTLMSLRREREQGWIGEEEPS